MTGGNRPQRMQQPYRGKYRMLWAWLQAKYPQVLEDYKQHRKRKKAFEWRGKIVIPEEIVES